MIGAFRSRSWTGRSNLSAKLCLPISADPRCCGAAHIRYCRGSQRCSELWAFRHDMIGTQTSSAKGREACLMVSERSLEVLRVIVQDYVASREPVGSKSIVERHAFGVSAATIRNDMALLEEEELIAAPHTSSGRVPTDKGYRVFVDQLTELRPLTAGAAPGHRDVPRRSPSTSTTCSRAPCACSRSSPTRSRSCSTRRSRSARVRARRARRARPHARCMIVLITDTGRVEQRVIDVRATESTTTFLGELRATLNAALGGLGAGAMRAGALARSRRRRSRRARRAASSRRSSRRLAEQVAANRQDRLVMAGAANLARTESDFRGSIYPVLEAIEEQVTLLKLFSEMVADEHGVSRRASAARTRRSAWARHRVLASGYTASGGSVARLGVLGPTRMDYSNNMAAVRAVARYLTRLLGDESSR